MAAPLGTVTGGGSVAWARGGVAAAEVAPVVDALCPQQLCESVCTSRAEGCLALSGQVEPEALDAVAQHAQIARRDDALDGVAVVDDDLHEGCEHAERVAGRERAVREGPAQQPRLSNCWRVDAAARERGEGEGSRTTRKVTGRAPQHAVTAVCGPA
jgi:hypothetical protein